MEYALQTLVYPLRFDPKTGLCTYAFSLDISLAHVSKRLREARTSPESTTIALSAAKRRSCSEVKSGICGLSIDIILTIVGVAR